MGAFCKKQGRERSKGRERGRVFFFSPSSSSFSKAKITFSSSGKPFDARPSRLLRSLHTQASEVGALFPPMAQAGLLPQVRLLSSWRGRERENKREREREQGER